MKLTWVAAILEGSDKKRHAKRTDEQSGDRFAAQQTGEEQSGDIDKFREIFEKFREILN